MEIDDLVKITKAFSNLVSAASTAEGIYESVTGNSGTAQIVKAIDKLDRDVKTGFQNVVQALNDQTLINNWSPISTSLADMYNSTYEYLLVLQSLTLSASKTYSGSYTVVVNEKEVRFADWCNGSEAEGLSSSLTTLASYLETANYGTNGNLSLAGMFTALPSGNSALDLWIQLVTQARGSGNPALSQFTNQTVYHLVNKFMGEIYTILGMIYYVHDASLAMLNKIGSSNTFYSLENIVKLNFGNVTTPDTIWATFAGELEKLATQPADPDGQYMNVSLSEMNYANTGSSMGNNNVVRASYLCTTTNQNLENAFFTSLQISHLYPNWAEGDYEMRNEVLFLQGVAVTVGPNMAMSLANNGDWVPSPTIPELMSVWSVSQNPNNQGTTFWDYTTPLTYVKNAVALYAAASIPTPLNDDQFTVVTGFGFSVSAADEATIQLQFGILDLSDITNPTVTPIPEFQQTATPTSQEGQFCIPGNIDLRPSGSFSIDASGNATNGMAIMTNASLANLPNNSLGLYVQMAAPVYRASFFQPTNILGATS